MWENWFTSWSARCDTHMIYIIDSNGHVLPLLSSNVFFPLVVNQCGKPWKILSAFPNLVKRLGFPGPCDTALTCAGQRPCDRGENKGILQREPHNCEELAELKSQQHVKKLEKHILLYYQSSMGNHGFWGAKLEVSVENHPKHCVDAHMSCWSPDPMALICSQYWRPPRESKDSCVDFKLRPTYVSPSLKRKHVLFACFCRNILHQRASVSIQHRGPIGCSSWKKKHHRLMNMFRSTVLTCFNPPS